MPFLCLLLDVHRTPLEIWSISYVDNQLYPLTLKFWKVFGLLVVLEEESFLNKLRVPFYYQWNVYVVCCFWLLVQWDKQSAGQAYRLGTGCIQKSSTLSGNLTYDYVNCWPWRWRRCGAADQGWNTCHSGLLLKFSVSGPSISFSWSFR